MKDSHLPTLHSRLLSDPQHWTEMGIGCSSSNKEVAFLQWPPEAGQGVCLTLEVAKTFEDFIPDCCLGKPQKVHTGSSPCLPTISFGPAYASGMSTV